MNRKRKLHKRISLLALLIAGYLCLPAVMAGELNGTEWKVTSGDTLYAIGRAIYPKSAPWQARLRQDIMDLNPDIFAGGANKMSVGVVLKLPEYVLSGSVPTKTTKPATVPAPAPLPTKAEVKATPKTSGAEWLVRSGDSLYLICRSIYPKDPQKMAQLGRDIRKLNPSIFKNRESDIAPGDVLKMPDYVDPKSIPSRPVEPAAPPPAQLKATPKPEPVAPAVIAKPEPAKPEPAKPEPVKPVTREKVKKPVKVKEKEQPASSTSISKSEVKAVVSLGFSQGGDRLVDVSNGTDIYAGTGLQLRLGYERMFESNHGYRAALGYQYYTLLEQRDVVYKDLYLQLAYQYRASPLILGIGVVLDSGAKLDSNINAEFKSAIGGTLYMEYVGEGLLNGWGLSTTSLQIKEKETGTAFDANRGEIYYNWRF